MPDHPKFDYDVFISYSSHDKQWVRNDLLIRIEQTGLRAFIDFRDFKRGAPSIKEMERGVATCRKTLLVLSPAYIESGWCEIENIMLQTLDPSNRSLRLIPLLKTKCEKPLRISALTHIDFTESADLDLAWHQLLNALEAEDEEPVEEPVPTEIQADIDRSKILMDADKFSEAIPILEKALADADASGLNLIRVKVRTSLALAIYETREDSSVAERHYRDALDIVPIGNRSLKYDVLHGLGDMLLVSGRIDEAKATIHAALNIANLTGKTEDIARSLISQAMLQKVLGFNDIAIEKLDEAMHLLLQRALSLSGNEKKENAHTLAVCYINKALICREAGNHHEAMTLYRKAEEQHLISGDKLDTGKDLLFCGEVHCANGEWEKGYDCFRRALGFFQETHNPLWSARGLENVSRLFATHEQWEEAARAMLGAAGAAEESGHYGEQVHFLCLSAKLLRKWKTKVGKDNIARMIHSLSKDIPEENRTKVVASLSARMDEFYDDIEKSVREDEEVHKLLNKAMTIAQEEGLHEHLANCLLDKAHNATPSGDTEAQRNLMLHAIELLKKKLLEVQSPKRRGFLMGRISVLYRELGEGSEALLWLKKSGEVFERFGDVLGLANFYCSLAEIHRLANRLDDEISAYRKALSIIEGRSFYELAAGTRINLAAALRYRREFAEASALLNEAEQICNRHQFNDFISAIAKNRSDIKKESQAAQAPRYSLQKLLESFNQLVTYSPEHSVAYLPFWYFAWNTELLALLRSGPHLSLMVITDNVDQFLRYSERFSHLADHFLMSSSHGPTVKVEPEILPIPPQWLFPKTFPFIFAKRKTPESGGMELQSMEKGGPVPSFRLEGPATLIPPYLMINAKSDVKGEGHMIVMLP